MRPTRLVAGVGIDRGLAGSARGEEKEGLKELAAASGEECPGGGGEEQAVGRPIGYFTPSGLDHASAGGGSWPRLADALGAFANPNAVFELKGEYLLVPDPLNAGPQGHQGQGPAHRHQHRGRRGRVQGVRRVHPRQPATSHASPARCRAQPGSGPREERNKDIQDGLPNGGDRPPANAVRPAEGPRSHRGTPGVGRPEVRVRRRGPGPPLDHGGRPAAARAPELVDGLPFVRIDKGGAVRGPGGKQLAARGGRHPGGRRHRPVRVQRRPRAVTEDGNGAGRGRQAGHRRLVYSSSRRPRMASPAK